MLDVSKMVDAIIEAVDSRMAKLAARVVRLEETPPLGVASAMIDNAGELVLTMSDGSLKRLGPVVGRDGAPGLPGKDGISFDDFNFDVEHDGERVFTLKWSNGDKEIVRKIGVPAMLYRGVFHEGRQYGCGDVVTYGGNLWYCREDTTDKPLDNAGAWQLAARKGRDARSAAK
jgi:hypothetical protein